jgi:hypothetical protein
MVPICKTYEKKLVCTICKTLVFVLFLEIIYVSYQVFYIRLTWGAFLRVYLRNVSSLQIV